MATEKVAITVEHELLNEVEQLRERTGESRSAVVNRALRQMLSSERRVRQVERYLQAYREHPETAAEIRDADQLARESFRHAPPWDEP